MLYQTVCEKRKKISLEFCIAGTLLSMSFRMTRGNDDDISFQKKTVSVCILNV